VHQPSLIVSFIYTKNCQIERIGKTLKCAFNRFMYFLMDTDSKLIDKINEKESKVCGFFSLTLSDILAPLEESECVKQG